MNRVLLSAIFLVAGLVAGLLLGSRTGMLQVLTGRDVKMDWGPAAASGKVGTMNGNDGPEHGKKVLYWVAPMDPAFRRDKPGKSPMGMDLVPVYAGADEGGDTATVSINPAVINNLGVQTGLVKRGTLWRMVTTVGYVDYDETRISHVHVRKEGWIEKLQVRAEGETVAKGQHLFDLYSPAMVNAQEEYLQSLMRGSQGLVRASREKLFALGISDTQISGLEKNRKVSQYVGFYAPQSGVLSRLNVREGMYIKPETEVMSLANLDRIWLIAEVFERQADWVKEGQPAAAEIPALPGRDWKGKVDYIYPDLDPVTRTLRVRLSFPNMDRDLMPNMSAHVRIHGTAKENALSIPREALIRGAESARVIMALDGGRFQAREVVAGIESGDRVEILDGLEEGDHIVTSAQFLIDSEASLKASLQRMQSHGE